jgi:hypothetical protein
MYVCVQNDEEESMREREIQPSFSPFGTTGNSSMAFLFVSDPSILDLGWTLGYRLLGLGPTQKILEGATTYTKEATTTNSAWNWKASAWHSSLSLSVAMVSSSSSISKFSTL